MMRMAISGADMLEDLKLKVQRSLLVGDAKKRQKEQIRAYEARLG